MYWGGIEPPTSGFVDRHSSPFELPVRLYCAQSHRGRRFESRLKSLCCLKECQGVQMPGNLNGLMSFPDKKSGNLFDREEPPAGEAGSL